MKKISIILTFILVFSVAFCGCGNNATTENDTNTPVSSVDLSFLKAEEDMFTSRDYEVGYSDGVEIALNGASASCDSDKVKIEGSVVTILDEGTYILSGSLDDGMIVVEAEETDKPQLVLNNVSINNEDSAAIYIVESDKVFITLEKDSENSIANGGSFDEEKDSNIDGAIFSKQDIVFNGSGKLTVNSPTGHGIVAKDDIKITSGDYIINSASHGIDANDSVRVANGTIGIDAGKDAIHVENTEDESLGYVYIIGGEFDLEAEGDGISASSIMQIQGGKFEVITGGGSANATKQTSDNFGGFMGDPHGKGGKDFGMNMQQNAVDNSDDGTSIKAFKSSGSMYIDNATITVDSADDAIHSNSSMVIQSGSFDLTTGDDGYHADQTLAIIDGQIKVNDSYEGIEGLDIEIYGGDINVVSTDDGINAAGGRDSSGMGGPRGDEGFGGGFGGPDMEKSSTGGSIAISGGKIYIEASGDGVDSNGTLDITGGYVEVCGPTNGDTAVLDYESTGTINGGTFVGTGAYMMAQTLASEDQGVIAVSVGSQSAGESIEIKDESGKAIADIVPELPYQILIYSSPEIEKGKTYTISIGSVSGDVEAN